MTTQDERTLAVLRKATEPMTARQIWERLGKVGAESSIGCRLATLRLEGFVYRVRPGDSSIDTPTLWRAFK
jgi:hypothetical protein